jgi:hypothetical protein
LDEHQPVFQRTEHKTLAVRGCVKSRDSQEFGEPTGLRPRISFREGFLGKGISYG